MDQTQTVQTGPDYVCPGCGKPIDFSCWSDGRYLQPEWNNIISRDWEKYVFYMHHVDRGGDKMCKQNLRVVRLGDCITPVVFMSEAEMPNYDERINEAVRRIRAALTEIAQAVRPEDRQNDLASKVVYGLMAGTLTPDMALDMLRDHVPHAKALLIVGEVSVALPADLAREVKARAQAQGQTLETFALNTLREQVTYVEPLAWLEAEMHPA